MYESIYDEPVQHVTVDPPATYESIGLVEWDEVAS